MHGEAGARAAPQRLGHAAFREAVPQHQVLEDEFYLGRFCSAGGRLGGEGGRLPLLKGRAQSEALPARGPPGPPGRLCSHLSGQSWWRWGGVSLRGSPGGWVPTTLLPSLSLLAASLSSSSFLGSSLGLLSFGSSDVLSLFSSHVRLSLGVT